MTNENPIYVDAEPVRTAFHIDRELRDKNLQITIEYKLADTGWLYGGTNYLLLDGNYIFRSDRKEPRNFKIAQLSMLDNAELKIKNRIFLIYPDGGVDKAIIFSQKINFYADNELIESFEAASKGDYFTPFNAWIKFELI
jgi:hypothetical protein